MRLKSWNVQHRYNQVMMGFERLNQNDLWLIKYYQLKLSISSISRLLCNHNTTFECMTRFSEMAIRGITDWCAWMVKHTVVFMIMCKT